MTPPKDHFPTLRNVNGGWYQSGKMFTMPKRLEIGYEYLDMCIDQWPNGRPSQRQLATKAKISQSTARKIIMELENTGSLTDPELTNSEKMRDREKEYYLEPTEELFLLALRSEKPARPNREYVAHLATYYGTVVSTSFISEWFKTRFNHKGSFRKPNLVPLNKFWQENVIRFINTS
jgi:DNA-binding Lrp family transcriptional regulator